MSSKFFAHETSCIDANAHIGDNTQIWRFSHILTGTNIKNNCDIGQNVVIGPDVYIGNGCKIQDNVTIYKGVIFEDDVFCGPSVVFTNVANPRTHVERKDEVRDTLVCKGASIGGNSTILCGVTIGEYALVGAGSVVTEHVPKHAIVYGNPAKFHGYACECGKKLKKLNCPACGLQFVQDKSIRTKIPDLVRRVIALQKNPLRVLHITASSMIGGGPEHVWKLVKYMPKTITSYIAAPDLKPYGPRFIAAVGKERVVNIPQRRFSLKSLWNVSQFIFQNKIQIIHSHGKGAGIYGRLLALMTFRKSVHTFHGLHLPKEDLPRKLYLLLEQKLGFISRACINVSPSEYQQVSKLGLAPNKLHVIVNGVEIPDGKQTHTMPEPFNILHISRFDHAKNSLLLCDIAKSMKKIDIISKCHFIVIGDGEQKRNLEQSVIEAGLAHHFNFLGEQEFVDTFWENAGCLVSTSLKEGLPLAVLEAQAHGVPAVVSEVMGNKDAIVHAKTGFLYPLDNPDKAAQCISSLVNNPSLWTSIAAQAHEHAKENFSVESMAEKTANLYIDVSRRKMRPKFRFFRGA